MQTHIRSSSKQETKENINTESNFNDFLSNGKP